MSVLTKMGHLIGYDRRVMTATPNLHEQRSRSTREALRRAALAPFAAKGFSNVTVTELAGEAGVTERTFFRHFLTKEAVLFPDYETQVEWLAEAWHNGRSQSRYSRRCWPASRASRMI